MVESAKADKEAPALLDGYINEEHLAAAIGKSLRRVREMRQMRIGPPFVKIGYLILYPRDGILAWVKSLEVSPPRHRGNRAA